MLWFIFLLHSKEHLGSVSFPHNVMVYNLSCVCMFVGAQESCKVNAAMRLPSLRIQQRVPGAYQSVIRVLQTPSYQSEYLPASPHISQPLFWLATLNSFPFCSSQSEPKTQTVHFMLSPLYSKPRCAQRSTFSFAEKPWKNCIPERWRGSEWPKQSRLWASEGRCVRKNKLLYLEAMFCSYSCYGSQSFTVIKAVESTCFQSFREWWPPPFQSIWTD